MTELIVDAERKLAACVEGMHAVLEATLQDALPMSGLGSSSGMPQGPDDASDIPDTLRQRLEWEQHVEEHRVHGMVAELSGRFQMLREAVMMLGGGVNAEGHLVDVPVPVLDADIARLSAESGRLGALMVEHYGEAQQLAATVEDEIMKQEIPSL